MIIPITQIQYEYSRSRAPGGWWVVGVSRTNYPDIRYFYPDPDHRWDGFVSWNDELEAGFLHD